MPDLSAYDYDLPADRIAQRPLANRVDARLMVVDRREGSIQHQYVRDLPDYLQPGDVLVLNNTRVVPARLVGRRVATGGRWEGLFLESDAQGCWRVMCKTRGKQTPGDVVMLGDDQLRDDTPLRMIEKQADGTWIVKPESEESPFALLDRIGRIPLPHYIRGGEMVEDDRKNYQTVFAEIPGAVAAPTAGLHFTAGLFARLRNKGVESVFVTLHVGLGTFNPIKAERLEEHKMHFEWGEISAETVAKLRSAREAGGRIVAVGTTSVRVLETASASGELVPWSGSTDLFIRPPYPFRSVDALLTNFHLPRSTLLVLVRTFGGDALIRHAYAEAIREEYRFYSYGDAMLIL